MRQNKNRTGVFMKLFFRYLKSKIWSLAAFFVFVGIFIAALLLYHIPVKAVLYPAFVCTLCGLGLLAAGFAKQWQRHVFLERAAGMAAAEIDSLPAPSDIDDEDYQKIIFSLKQQTAEMLCDNKRKLRDTVEYYTLWAHQIKTPIASMKLALEGEDTPLSRRLNSDLFRIEQYAEMVMTYLRLDFENTDYVLKEHHADSLIKKSVKSFSGEFINKRLSLDYSPVKTSIVTDEKWFCFVLEQLISNALKYTNEGGVKIYMKDGSLCIEDSGIGIAKEDLPRIFERGYTGMTGRNDRRSSGIGLYLCKRICKNLNIGIKASSKVGEGSVFELDLKETIKNRDSQAIDEAANRRD